MGRTPEPLHPRQAEIDHILRSTAGRGRTGQVPRLLREAGIDPQELGIMGDERDRPRINKLRHEAKKRLNPSPTEGFMAAAARANEAAERVRVVRHELEVAEAELEEALAKLRAEEDRLI